VITKHCPNFPPSADDETACNVPSHVQTPAMILPKEVAWNGIRFQTASQKCVRNHDLCLPHMINVGKLTCKRLKTSFSRLFATHQVTMPVQSGAVLRTFPLDFVWDTADPFLFCVHHNDMYPAGQSTLGPDRSLLNGMQLRTPSDSYCLVSKFMSCYVMKPLLYLCYLVTYIRSRIILKLRVQPSKFATCATYFMCPDVYTQLCEGTLLRPAGDCFRFGMML
jgi:hypothetical protein